jgi:hypothetical protein
MIKHQETWCNQHEELRFVWSDGTTGIGRMRHSQNKGIGFSQGNYRHIRV